MNFSEWTTLFEHLRVATHDSARRARRGPFDEAEEGQTREEALEVAKHFPTNPKSFYQMMQRRILEEIYRTKQQTPGDECSRQCLAYNQSVVEMSWSILDRPYFKLYPGIVDMLASSDIKVPANLVHSPIETMAIRLPEDHAVPELTTDSGWPLLSILVNEVQSGSLVRVSDIVGGEPSTEKRRFIFWFDFGEHSEIDTHLGKKRLPVVSMQTMAIEDEEASFEDNLMQWLGKNRVDWDSDIDVSDENILNCIRLAVGTCLLATNFDKVVEADVLNRHVDRFKVADQKEREQLHEKAIKRGKHGWTVGREISLPSRATTHDSDSDATGRQLKASHLRRGHFHTVRYGEGRSKSKVQWFRPVVVRPDLPAADTERGYKAE